MKLLRFILQAGLVVLSLWMFFAPPLTHASTEVQTVHPEDPKTDRLSGRVVLDSGKPVSGATIIARQIGSREAHSATSDENGGFVFTGLARGLYRLTITAPGYVIANRSEPLEDEVYRVGSFATITMTKGGVITGRVLNAEGTPITGLSVKAVRVKGRDGGRLTTAQTTYERLTDDRGVYRIYGLAPGKYQVSVGGNSNLGGPTKFYEFDSPSFYPSESRDGALDIEVEAGMEVTAINIIHRGRPGHSIRGSVAGLPQESVSVFITLERIGSSATEYFATSQMNSDQNSFMINGVADGEYLLIARGRTKVVDSIATSKLTIRGKDLIDLKLSMMNLGAILGRIETTADFQPCTKQFELETMAIGVNARLASEVSEPESVSPFGLRRNLSTAIENDGSLSITGLRAGLYRLALALPDNSLYVQSVQSPGNQAKATTKISNDVAQNGIALKAGELRSGVVVTIATGAATLEGRIQGASTRLKIILVPTDADRADSILRFVQAIVGDDGSFKFANIAPGRYSLVTSVVTDSDPENLERSLWDPKVRIALRNKAKSEGQAIEFSRCQKLKGFELILKQ